MKYLMCSTEPLRLISRLEWMRQANVYAEDT